MYKSAYSRIKLRSLYSDNEDDIQTSSGSSAETSNPADSVKLLIVINENSTLNQSILFLKRRGYNIQTVHRVMDIINKLTQFNPDILLLSWNLKNTNMGKVYNLLSNKVDIPKIVFSEENSTKSSNSLMRSGIPHTLLPPVSGAGMHMRIQSLLRNKNNSGSENKSIKRLYKSAADTESKTIVKSLPFQNKLIEIDHIEKTAHWSLSVDSKHEQSKIWKGVSLKDNKKSFYYFKGPKVPEYNALKEKWEGVGEMLMTSEKEEDPSQLVILQEASFLESQEAKNHREMEEKIDSLIPFETGLFNNDTEYEAEQEQKGLSEIDMLKKFEEALNNAKTPSPSEPSLLSSKTGKSMSLLQKGVMEAVKQVCKDEKKQVHPLQSLSHFSANIIKSLNYKGYLVGCHGKNIPDLNLMKDVVLHVSKFMDESGDPLKGDFGAMELKVEEMLSSLWTEQKADFTIKSSHKDEEVAFSFFSTESLPEIIEEDREDFVGVDISYIWPDKVLLFDLYIHLPKNNKFLRYLKKDSLLSEKTLSKLLNFNIRKVYIQRSQLDLFQIYCAKYKFQETLKKAA